MFEGRQYRKELLDGMFEIAKQYPNDLEFKNIEDFEEYINKQIDCRVGIRDGEVIGFGFLEYLANQDGCIALYVKKGRFIRPQILKGLIDSYMKKHDITILSAVTRADNYECVKLLDKLGFSCFNLIENYRNGADYVIASVVRR